MKISSSRPTTAKKMMLSPRSHKTKSEGKDLDLTQLCDAMYPPSHVDRKP